MRSVRRGCVRIAQVECEAGQRSGIRGERAQAALDDHGLERQHGRVVVGRARQEEHGI